RRVQSVAIRGGGHTSAYDSMERPFRADNRRGHWAKSIDFYFASSSYAFSTLAFSDATVWALMIGGWTYFLTAYLMAICFYSLPIFLIQTFLGQFSSSGAISAFRVSPIFKGVGYSILLLNLGTLIYYGVNAAVPLIYAINSLRNVMPWMSCNNTWNTPNCSTHDTYDENTLLARFFRYFNKSFVFFSYVIGSRDEDSHSLSLSWPMVLAIVGIWLVVLVLLLNRVSIIGKTLRCVCVLMFASFFAVFCYLVIHEQVGWQSFLDYLHPSIFSWQSISSVVATGILNASMMLGPGWGSIITLGSYNRFHSDGDRHSGWVCFTHVIVTVMAVICGHVANDHFELHVAMWHVEKQHSMQFLYVAFPYLFASFTTLPHLWAFLFFMVIFLAEMSALVSSASPIDSLAANSFSILYARQTILLLSVLTTLFDEFEQLRPYKQHIKVLLVLALMASSIYFCTQLGFSQVSALSYMTLFTQIIISAILVLMGTWIYGRMRFQCDLQFMLGKTISSLKIFIIRFITPLFIALGLWEACYMLIVSGAGSTLIWTSQSCIYLLALGYMVYKVCQTTGTGHQRVRQCFAPHDWHPVDADNRRFYEEIMGTSEMLVIDNGNNA
ncbi:hypothetical protein KR222_011666, partial [Zaprionus bogoriensis]